MKLIAGLIICLCLTSAANAGPKINFNFGIDRYYYGPPAPIVPPQPYGYYDAWGNYHIIRPNPYPPRYWHYGPSIGFQIKPR